MATINNFYENDKEVIETLGELLELHEQELLLADVVVASLKKIVHRYHYTAEDRGESN